jgi:hypothetical protein
MHSKITTSTGKQSQRLLLGFHQACRQDNIVEHRMAPHGMVDLCHVMPRQFDEQVKETHLLFTREPLPAGWDS